MIATGHPIDGSLESWEDVRDLPHDWDALLAGNGLSRNIWERFGYQSLYEQAKSIPAAKGGLSAVDLLLFETANTENFELVLADLRKTIRNAAALNEDTEPYSERYRSIRMLREASYVLSTSLASRRLSMR